MVKLMKIAVLGATGKFGRLFIAKLLSIPNYQITAISKSAENIYENSHRVTAKSIDATNQKDLKKALKNQEIVFCAVSGPDQVVIARNLVELNVKRLIFMSVVGIYNELPEGNGDEFNLDNEAEQRVHRNAADIIEGSSLDYTIFRPGYLLYNDDEDYIITKKGENAKGYVSNAKSIEKIALDIIKKPELYSRESIAITKNMS